MTATKKQRLGLSTGVFLLSQIGMAAYHEGMMGAIIGTGIAMFAWKFADEVFDGDGSNGGSNSPQPLAVAGEGRKYGLAARLLKSRDQRRAEAAAYEDLDEEYDLGEGSESETIRGRPDNFTFSMLLSNGWRPSKEQIYLAMLDNGEHVFISLEELVHIALAGSTRQGKTSIIRQLMSELIYIGCDCILLDPHFTKYDVENDEDWTPFIPHLQRLNVHPEQCVKYSRIEEVLRFASTTILEKRKALRRASKPVGKHMFFFLDEYPAIVAECEGVQADIAKLLREGGKYKMHLVIASQDFQVRTAFPDIGGSVRDCFSTCLYVGGDKVTVREILEADIPKSMEATLGKGPIYLRCPTCKVASRGYTPWIDNKSVYTLVGPTTYKKEVDTEALKTPAESDHMPVDRTDSDLPYTARAAAASPTVASVENESETASVSPNIEKWLKSDDLHIDTLVQAWNAGINTVDGIKGFFHMKQGEAYKAYKRVKDLKKEPVDGPESSQE